MNSQRYTEYVNWKPFSLIVHESCFLAVHVFAVKYMYWSETSDGRMEWVIYNENIETTSRTCEKLETSPCFNHINYFPWAKNLEKNGVGL